MKKLIGLLLLVSVLGFAALPPTTVWEIRPTVGSDITASGCFDSALIGTGTDFSQQNAAQYTATDLVSVSSLVVSSASHSFVTADRGNCIHITAGTGFTIGYYEIVTVAAGQATLDRSPGTVGAGGTYYVGGALATIGQMNSNATSNNITWVKATGTISTTAGITINYTSSIGANGTTQISGYTSTRGDNGQVTVLQSSGTSTMITIVSGVQGLTFRNFILNCNSTASFALQIQNSANRAENILAENCGAADAVIFNNGFNACVRCTVTGFTGSVAAFRMDQSNGPNYCVFCVAVGNSATGFYGSMVCTVCIAGNNTGGSSDGFQIGGGGTSGSELVICQLCLAYKNGRDGFNFGNSTVIPLVYNSISFGNTSFGFAATTLVPSGGFGLNWNAYGSNTGGNLSNVSAGGNDVTLTVDPFVNGAGNNFALNSTAGGGKGLRGAGFPGALVVGGTGFLDIGALQTAGSAGGGQVGFGIIQ